MGTTAITSVSASATHTLATLLGGPRRRVRRLGRSSRASWYAIGPSRVVVLQPAGAPRLPCALVTPEPVLLDEPVTAGDGALSAAGCEVRVGRVVSLRVPQLPTPSPDRMRAVAASVQPIRPDLSLLGCGPGLTPFADDVLVGYLAAARAWRLPADALAAEAVVAAASRTTSLSAALLACAAAGEVTPPVTTFLRALSGQGEVAAAVAGVLAVGASSGHGLAAGALAAGWEAAG